jgi:hypothetical protein
LLFFFLSFSCIIIILCIVYFIIWDVWVC